MPDGCQQLANLSSNRQRQWLHRATSVPHWFADCRRWPAFLPPPPNPFLASTAAWVRTVVIPMKHRFSLTMAALQRRFQCRLSQRNSDHLWRWYPTTFRLYWYCRAQSDDRLMRNRIVVLGLICDPTSLVCRRDQCGGYLRLAERLNHFASALAVDLMMAIPIGDRARCQPRDAATFDNGRLRLVRLPSFVQAARRAVSASSKSRLLLEAGGAIALPLGGKCGGGRIKLSNPASGMNGFE